MIIPSFNSHPEVDPRIMPQQCASTLPDSLRRLYFKRLTVGHPRMLQIISKVSKITLPESGFDIVLVIGPTGVGKTEILRKMLEDIFIEHEAEMNVNKGLIPAIAIEIPEIGQKQFAWSALYGALFEQLNDRLQQHKVETRDTDGILTVIPRTGYSSTVTALQMALKIGLEVRNTRVVFIDEASHLMGHLGGNSLLNLANAFKSLSNVGRTILVLAGSYDLLKLMELSGQLTRRICVIHYTRYGNSVNDKDTFRSALHKMQSYLPTPVQPDLSPHAYSIQRACLGCVGIAKQTLQRALANALENGGVWKLEHIQEALLSDGACQKIQREILAGESAIRKFLSSEDFTICPTNNSSSGAQVQHRRLKGSPSPIQQEGE